MVEKITKRKLDGKNSKINKASAKTCGETSPGIKNKDRKMSGKIVEPKVKSNSSYDMLSWQLCFLQVGIPHFCKIFSPAPVGKIKLT
jgi:hypothetical protein